MSLTDKYSSVYNLAQQLGCDPLSATEDGGKLVLKANAPHQYAANQLWDAIKEIDPDLSHGDLVFDWSVARDDIFGEYTVKSGDTLSGIAKKVTGNKLSYQQIFEANRHILNDPNKIQVGQKLTIPKH